MTSTTTSRSARPPTFNTLDPFQRARRADKTSKTGRVLGSTSILHDGLPVRESRSLDLDVKQRLPIGPRPNGSGSRKSSATHSPNQAPADNRKTRALRRQGSLFNVPTTLNPAANASSSSLASMYSQASAVSVASLPEVKGFSATRRRNSNIPAPLALHVNTIPPTKHNRISPAPRREAPHSSQLSHGRSQTLSAALLSDASSSVGTPTPLTPSFRFHAAAIPSHRRKKLQKLARTLGENIPPDLVFPSHPYLDGSAPATPTSEQVDSFGAPYDDKVQSNRDARRSSITKSVLSGHERVSAGMMYALRTNVFPQLPIPKRDAKGISRWEPPVEWTLGPSDSIKYDDCSEDEVLGLWNADSYDTVMDRLRHLKT